MTQQQTPIEESQIRAKAHELWVERGCPNGTPDDDWYRAEQLLRETAVAKRPRKKAAKPAAARPKKTRTRKS
jgi:hypothetical protein